MSDERPAARLLILLELLQDRPGISGPAIAERLGVSTRTVRRYVATLQDMGIPVAPSPGRLGGYRLLPGFRLPPLMFNAEEAVGLAVALLATRATAYDDLPTAVSSAFGKIQRVLPTSLARQLDALRQVTRLPNQTSTGRRRFPDPAVLGGSCSSGTHASALQHPLPPRSGVREPARARSVWACHRLRSLVCP
ncbi:MAG: HTH domain-containing protein, partial [Actinomycetota bacterium]|nr:HTH domain-containing protein [Actinomycetota bacterium]